MLESCLHQPGAHQSSISGWSLRVLPSASEALYCALQTCRLSDLPQTTRRCCRSRRAWPGQLVSSPCSNCSGVCAAQYILALDERVCDLWSIGEYSKCSSKHTCCLWLWARMEMLALSRLCVAVDLLCMFFFYRFRLRGWRLHHNQ